MLSFFDDFDDELYGAPEPVAWIGMEFRADERRRIEQKLRLGFGVDIYTDDSDMAICIGTAFSLDGVYWWTRDVFVCSQSSRQRGRRFTNNLEKT